MIGYLHLVRLAHWLDTHDVKSVQKPTVVGGRRVSICSSHTALTETNVRHPDRARVTRRHLISGAAALTATGAVRPLAAFGQGSAAPHVIKLGAIEILVLSDGAFTQPLSVMLPGRPEAEVVAAFERHGARFSGLNAQVNVTLIRSGGDLILIDAGAGPDFMPTLGRFADHLDAAGIKPEAITKVVFTHAHADHFWGVIDPLGGGTLFEKARHMMTAPERDFWLRPDVESRVGDAFKAMAVGTHRRLKSIAERIETVRPGQEIAPGVALVDTAGHSPGHVSVMVSAGSEQLLVGGDALIQSVISFTAPDWRWGPDMDADQAVATRKILLDRLASDKTSLIGTHLPWPGIGRVERKDLAFRFIPG